MTRADWQQIAEERLLAAQALLTVGLWPSAYYLSGYAVECGLKSCILARVAMEPEVIYVEKRFSEKCWTHKSEELLKLAGLEPIRNLDNSSNVDLAENWEIVKDWSEESRYQVKTQKEAERLYLSIAENANGVMQWIRARW